MLRKRGIWIVLIFALGLFFTCYRPEAEHYDLYGAQPGDPLPGLSLRQHHIFNKGLVLFKHDFEPEEGLGPLFNGRSCFECHGKPTAVGLEGKDVSTTGVVRVGMIVPSSPLSKDLKKAKEQADIFDFSGLIDKGGPALQRKSITQEFPGKYPADLNVEVGLVPPQAQFISLRHAPPLLGLGLIDAISDQTILANMFRESKIAPRLVGRTNPLSDPLTRATRIGKFGWKDQQPDLLLFTAEALNAEMGITTFIQNAPKSATGIAEVPKKLAAFLPHEPNDIGENLVQLAAFQALLAPPSRPVLDEHSRHGQQLFAKLQCAVCHTPELPTAQVVEIPDPASPFPQLHYLEVKSLENQPVRLYSDLLLHSMGPALADGIVQGTARGGEWRTTPLWGLRYKKFYLHDGRARTLEKAILAHGGQADAATSAYRALCDEDKKDLLAFLKAL